MRMTDEEIVRDNTPAEIDVQAVIHFLRKADLKGGRRVAADVVIETLERGIQDHV